MESGQSQMKQIEKLKSQYAPVRGCYVLFTVGFFTAGLGIISGMLLDNDLAPPSATMWLRWGAPVAMSIGLVLVGLSLAKAWYVARSYWGMLWTVGASLDAGPRWPYLLGTAVVLVVGVALAFIGSVAS